MDLGNTQRLGAGFSPVDEQSRTASSKALLSVPAPKIYPPSKGPQPGDPEQLHSAWVLCTMMSGKSWSCPKECVVCLASPVFLCTPSLMNCSLNKGSHDVKPLGNNHVIALLCKFTIHENVLNGLRNLAIKKSIELY